MIQAVGHGGEVIDAWRQRLECHVDQLLYPELGILLQRLLLPDRVEVLYAPQHLLVHPTVCHYGGQQAPSDTNCPIRRSIFILRSCPTISFRSPCA